MFCLPSIAFVILIFVLYIICIYICVILFLPMDHKGHMRILAEPKMSRVGEVYERILYSWID